jgi:hypothetical protein
VAFNIREQSLCVNGKGLTDATKFSIPKQNKELYLNPIMDFYDNSVIEYELSFRNNHHLVFKMFDKAIEKNPETTHLFHSNRNFQYTSKSFKNKLGKLLEIVLIDYIFLPKPLNYSK